VAKCVPDSGRGTWPRDPGGGWLLLRKLRISFSTLVGAVSSKITFKHVYVGLAIEPLPPEAFVLFLDLNLFKQIRKPLPFQKLWYVIMVIEYFGLGPSPLWQIGLLLL